LSEQLSVSLQSQKDPITSLDQNVGPARPRRLGRITGLRLRLTTAKFHRHRYDGIPHKWDSGYIKGKNSHVNRMSPNALIAGYKRFPISLDKLDPAW